MAEGNAKNKDSLVQEKAELDRFFQQVNQAVPALNKELEAAQSAGNSELAAKLSNDILTVQGEVESKSQRYADLDFEISSDIGNIQESTKRLREGTTKEEFVTRPAMVGGFGGSMPSYTPAQFDKKLVEDQKKQDLSLVSGVVPENIDVNPKNVPASQRATLGAMVSPESRGKYLESKYGTQQPDGTITGNVLPLTINGNNEFLVKRKDGTAFTTEDKGLAGTLGAMAVETPIVVGETAAFLGTLGATKSPGLAYAASGASRAGMGSIIDPAIEALSGVEPQYFQAFTRRGTEALVGVAAGGLIDMGTSKFLANRLAPQFTNEFANTLEKSATRLTAREQAAASAAGRQAGEVSIPAGAGIAGPLGLESQQYLAGRLKGSSLAGFSGAMKRTQDTVRSLWDSFVNETPLNPSSFRAAAQSQLQNRQKLAEEIARRSNMSVTAVRQNLDNRLSQYSEIVSNEDELGRLIGAATNQAKEAQNKIKSETFDRAFDFADELGANQDPKELLNFVVNTRRAESKKGAFDNTAVRTVEARLERRANAQELLDETLAKIDKYQQAGKEVPSSLTKEVGELEALIGPMDAREFDYWIRAVKDARPDGAVGAKTKDQLGMAVSKKMAEYRRDFYSSYQRTNEDGTIENLGDFYGNAVNEYDKRMQYEVNLLGRILNEEGGQQKMFPREIVSAVMAEPAKIRNVMDAVAQYEAQDQSRAGLSGQIRGMMQNQYINSLGLGRPGVNVNSIKYDQGMVRELWGNSADRLMRSMDELNNTFGKTNLGKKLTPLDVELMGNALDENSRKQVLKQIDLRLKAEADLERLQNNEIFKLAQKNNFESLDPDMLSKFILSDGSTSSQVQSTLVNLSKFSQEERNAFKGDFVRELLNSFPGGQYSVSEPFTPMFDTVNFAKAMEAPIGTSALRKKVEAVLGKEDADFLYDLAVVNNANQIKYTPDKEPLRMTAGLSGVSLYLANGVTSGVKNRLMAVMLTASKKERKGLNRAIRAMAAGTGDSGQIDLAYKNIMKDVFTTRNGLTALARQAQDNEEFSLYLHDMANRFREDDRELDQMMGEE